MLTKRIIPCLDIKDGRTVKGINFEGLRDAGDPVELASKYAKEGADELVFLDISATNEKRKTLVELVEKIASKINIPFTVGGGVASVEDGQRLLMAGADKIAINSAAVNRPIIITELSKSFGNQCVVLAIDAKLINGSWVVFVNGGKVATSLNLFKWAKQGEILGAGEILFTSMNGDGAQNGFSLEALAELNKILSIPVIASGGAGTIQHFEDALNTGKADAVLAASVFHFNKISIPELKKELLKKSISVRPIN